jgi:hypothetical protein
MTDEVPLLGGDVTIGVVRVGDTVRRPTSASTPAIHALLRHLESVGFTGAPRALGIDDRGREILSYVPGDVPTRPLPGWAATDRVLAGVGRLLRAFHDATAGFDLPPGVTWPVPGPLPPSVPAEPPPEVVGHADVTPDNVVFRSGEPVALIDFDLAHPLSRCLDVVITARHWVPLVDPVDRPAVLTDADGAARLAVLCDSYGLGDDDRRQLVDVAIARNVRSQWLMRERALAEPGSGWERMWQEGVGDVLGRAVTWLAKGRGELESALIRT